MKITLPTEPFKTTLAKLANPPGEEPVHIGTLAVVITAGEFDGITLRRTTTNANITQGAEGTCEEEGECAVDYGVLVAALGGFAHKEVTLASDNDAPAKKEPFNLHITAGKSRATIQCFNPEDVLPPVAGGKTVSEITLLTTELDGYLATAMPAASDDTANKPHLAGVCFRTQRGQATIFAVDGRRFHLRFAGARENPFLPHEGKDMGAMIPTACAAMLRKLISGPEAKIGLTVAESSIKAASGQMCAILPLSAKAPPHVDAILPWDQKPTETAVCNREALLRIIRACSPLGYQDDKIITVKFTPGAVVAEADNGRGAIVLHEVDAQTSCKKGEQIYRIKASWFAEMLDHSLGEEITLEYFNAATSAPMFCTRAPDRLLCVLLMRDQTAAKA